MTDNFVSRKCCHCGTVAEYPLPSDFKTAIPKYLDGKPFEDENFSLKRTIMRCPKCGYVSFDVSRNILKDSRIVSTDDYEAIIKSDILPRYIADYIAIGYIYESQSEFYHASHAYLCAAWGCMDEKRTKEEEILLEKAAKLILKHIGSPEFKAHPDLNMLQCAVDILRRIREFDNAKKLAAYALSKNLPEDMKKNFLLEQSLCDNYISAPHALKPANETKITGFSDLFNRFAEAQTGDDKLKLQVFAEAAEYVNKVKFAEVSKGVSLVYNPFFNQGLDFIRAVNKTRDALSDKTPTPSEKVPTQEKAPLQPVKVLTKAEDLKPQVSSEEKPEKMPETVSEEQIIAEDKPEKEQTFEEKPSSVKILTSKEDLDEEESEKTPCLDEIKEAEKPQDIAETVEEEIPKESLDEEENTVEEAAEELPEEEISEEETAEENLEEERQIEETTEAEESTEEENFVEEEVEEPVEENFEEEVSDEEPSEESFEEEAFEEFTEKKIEEVPEEENAVEEEAEEPVEESLEEPVEEEPSEDSFEEESHIEETAEAEESPEELEEEVEEPVEEISIEETAKENLDEEEVEEPSEESSDEEISEEPVEESLEEQIPAEETTEEEELVEESFDEPVEEEVSSAEETPEETPEKDLSEEEPFEPTYEEQCETITTLASIDGVISVSEVQALFEYGYVKARDLLEKMADDGYLTRTDAPETFAYEK